jgi:hypothetical protein
VNQGLSARFRPWARERACSGRQTTHRQALLYKASKLRLTRDPAGDAFERDAAALVFEPAGGGPALQMFPRPPLIRRVEVRSWFGAHELLLVAVHLRAPRPGSRLATAIDESRRMALEALADWLGTVHRRDPLLPIVLAGTFWEQRGADAIQMLKRRSGLVDLSERAAPDAFTFRAAGDSFRAYVDFILVTPELLDDRAPRDPVLAIDEIEAEFGERVTDRRPQFVALRVETRARIRRARERALDR